ncbi:hypothetical protein L484_015951 [Morus notabilis]|uniref:DYW domain-containing protein n=1 Tax=Morus notabilis TaxID=981085 RepID=W9QNH2_9ROSA|nr:pentatricopeptide repeat-containing protein At3g47530 [Morus notabilis]EXB44694.1 hypothetical protein L484_015951 [Morus notabilis]
MRKNKPFSLTTLHPHFPSTSRRRSAATLAQLPPLKTQHQPLLNPTKPPSKTHQRNPVPPTKQIQEHPLISIIKSCSHNTHLRQIHAHLLRTSLAQDPTISLKFLSCIALSSLRDIGYSRKFFAQIKRPSFLHHNAMIRAYSVTDKPDEGLRMYQDMIRRGVWANSFSSSFAVKCCVRISSFVGGVQVHGRILRDGNLSDCRLLTTLMELYSGCERFGDALKVFDEMPKRDTVAWNVLISCCLRNKRTRDALSLFDAMQSEEYGCEPDEVSCLLVLQACANLNALEFGERIRRYIDEHGYGGHTNLRNSLVSMYSRCGSLDKAYEVFRGLQDKNVVSWSAMISGLAINGYGREAINAFEEMQKTGVKPDAQTFTGILSACSHCGLVDEGMMFFGRMSKGFGISPNIHHYGCMVDLLGRAGLLDRAYRLIMSMDVKPDPEIWRTLLGACRIHGHVNLGERVIGHLIELKAQEAGDYVLLLNIYSSAGNWDKVTELRKFLKDEALQTTPGCSTIELKGVVHEFVADDVSHLRKDEIYEMLAEINSQLKIAGYVVEISSELHNLGAQEREFVLSYHSEKLAIAFGVLSTPPGTTIRVAKNIRTCVDCHNFAKVLSGVYNRQVVIRDRTRFHHFLEGRCSCNDYW